MEKDKDGRQQTTIAFGSVGGTPNAAQFLVGKSKGVSLVEIVLCF